MKVRTGFVSNSSSTSFIISNNSNKDLSLVDFVKENPQLIVDFTNQYTWYKDNYGYTQMGLILSAEKNNIIFPANSSNEYTFGDESGTVIGTVFDYILREGGNSDNFSWSFNEFYR